MTRKSTQNRAPYGVFINNFFICLAQNAITTLIFATSLASTIMRVQNSTLNFIHINELDSTNNYVANVVRRGEIHSGTVVSADFQREGRGHRATKWQSLVAQNALFSIYLRWEDFKAREQFQLSMLAALSIVETLKGFGIQKVQIKWPNDVYVDGKKIGGILIENDLNGQQIGSSIIGIGLNVNQVQFDTHISATSLKLESGQAFDVQTVLKKISNTLLAKLEQTADMASIFYELKKQYLTNLLGFQEYVRVLNQLTQEEISIKPIDISQSGQLLAVNEHSQLLSFDIKDIVWLLDEK